MAGRSQSYLSRAVRTLPLLALVLLLLSALYLAAGATTSQSALAANFPWILGATIVALLVILAALVDRLLRLRKRVQKQEPGALFTRRLVIVFVALSIPPAIIVFVFALGFLTRSVESWFSVQVSEGLDDALAIGQIYLDGRTREALNLTQQIADDLADLDRVSRVRRLSALADVYGADELTIFGAGLNIQGTSFREGGRLGPEFPKAFDLFLLRDNGFYAGAEPLDVNSDEMNVRVLVPLEDGSFGGEELLLQAMFPVPERYEGLAGNVSRQRQNYETLAFLRTQLETSFALVLSLVLLMSVLLAVLLAFNTARRLVRPMSELSEATRLVAGGDFAHTLTVPAQDELGFLVQSFNAMTERLSETSVAAARSRKETEQQRNYLEGLLSRLSSAVLSFGERAELITSNSMAASILDFEEKTEQPRDIDELERQYPRLRPLFDSVRRRVREQTPEWVEEIILTRHERRQVLMCRGARLIDSAVGRGVQVVVVDDVTNLIQAQREAAWGEVARRMAHEVKNPLTPIQLSAERMRRRYLATMTPEDAELLDKCTTTIVSQVHALKHMVNAFSEYARAPELNMKPVLISAVVEEVVNLYVAGDKALKVDYAWVENEPDIAGDSGRVRQLIHNLIKNAQEAAEARPLVLRFASRLVERRGTPFLAVSLEDNGPGVPKEILDRLFEPYATTKPRGTGLGLSIVKKIVEEHGGTIRVSNTADSGARFTAEFPVEKQERPDDQPQL